MQGNYIEISSTWLAVCSEYNIVYMEYYLMVSFSMFKQIICAFYLYT